MYKIKFKKLLNDKKNIFVGIAIVIVVVGAVLGYSLLNNRNQKNNRKGVDEKILKKYQIADSKGITKNTLNWLSKQADHKNIYTVGLTCDKDKNCSYMGSNRTMSTVIWARARYLMANNDKDELTLLRRDLFNYDDNKKVPEIQPNFWHCLLLFDVYQSKIADKGFDKQLTSLCMKSSYESAVVSPLLHSPDDFKNRMVSQIIDALINKDKIDKLIKSNSSKNENKDLAEEYEDVRQYFFTSGDRLAQYLWNKDEKNLIDAYGDMMASVETYKDQQITVKAYEGCQLGVSSLMLYQMSQDKLYKDFAEMVFDQQSKKIDKDSEEDSAICAFFADKMFNEFKDEKYLAKKNELLKYQVEKYVDNSDGAFFTKFGDKTNKKVRFNGLFAGLLAIQ
jgi:hypothetical protein